MGGVGAKDALKPRIFLSYSRSDSLFIEELAAALAYEGYTVDYDLSPDGQRDPTIAIAAEDEWWQRLQDMIDQADLFIVCASPSSASSQTCDDEIAWARHAGKRVIAILVREIDFAKAPPRLAALNVKISFASTHGQVAGSAPFNDLITAIEQDIHWLRKSTQLITAARSWAKAGTPNDKLLRGLEIADAQAWAAARPAIVPPVSDEVLGFISASQQFDLKLKRRRRAAISTLIALAFLMAVASVIAAQIHIQRLMDRNTQFSETTVIASRDALEVGDADRALRLALIAGDDGILSPSFQGSEFQIFRAYFDLRLLAEKQTGSNHPVSVSAFPDGRFSAQTCQDDEWRIDPADVGQEPFTRTSPASGSNVCVRAGAAGFPFVAEGTRDGNVDLFDPSEGGSRRLTQSSALDSEIAIISISGDGRLIAASDKTGTVAPFWTDQSQANSSLTRFNTGGPVSGLKFANDGQCLFASSYASNNIHIYSTKGGSLDRHSVPEDRGIASLQTIPLRNQLVSAAGKNISIWNVGADCSLSLQASLIGHADTILGVAVASGGNRLASTAVNGEIVIWDLDADRWRPRHLPQLSDRASFPVFLNNGKRVLVAVDDGKTWVFDEHVDGWERFATLGGHGDRVHSLATSSDGKSVMSGAADGSVRLWSLTAPVSDARSELLSEEYVSRLPLRALVALDGLGVELDADPVAASEVFADGSVALYSSDERLRVWSPNPGGAAQTFNIAEGLKYLSVVKGAGTDRFISGHIDGTLRIWNRQGEVLPAIPGHEEMVTGVWLSQDGRTAISSSAIKNTVSIWNLDGNGIWQKHKIIKFDAIVPGFKFDGAETLTVQLARAGRTQWTQTVTLRGFEQFLRGSPSTPKLRNFICEGIMGDERPIVAPLRPEMLALTGQDLNFHPLLRLNGWTEGDNVCSTKRRGIDAIGTNLRRRLPH